jgi:rubrerythrin
MAKKFKCLVCGYVHEGETAPEECPLCFVGSEDFKEISDEDAE